MIELLIAVPALGLYDLTILVLRGGRVAQGRRVAWYFVLLLRFFISFLLRLICCLSQLLLQLTDLSLKIAVCLIQLLNSIFILTFKFIDIILLNCEILI